MVEFINRSICQNLFPHNLSVYRNAFVSARNLFGGEISDASQLWVSWSSCEKHRHFVYYIARFDLYLSYYWTGSLHLSIGVLWKIQEPIQNLHLASPTKEDERGASGKESLLESELTPVREALSPITSNAKPNSAYGSPPMLKPMTPKTPMISTNAENMQMSGTCQKFNAWSTNVKVRINIFQNMCYSLDKKLEIWSFLQHLSFHRLLSWENMFTSWIQQTSKNSLHSPFSSASSEPLG